MHPFVILMIATFLAAVGTMFYGIINMGKGDKDHGEKSNKLMRLRVILCGLLLAEILIYANFIKP